MEAQVSKYSVNQFEDRYFTGRRTLQQGRLARQRPARRPQKKAQQRMLANITKGKLKAADIECES
jgi:hypothetical protein